MPSFTISDLIKFTILIFCSCERMWPKCGLYKYLPLTACIVDNEYLWWSVYKKFLSGLENIRVFLSFHLKCYVDAGTKININVPDMSYSSLIHNHFHHMMKGRNQSRNQILNCHSLVQVILVYICNISAFILQDNQYWSKNKV